MSEDSPDGTDDGAAVTGGGVSSRCRVSTALTLLEGIPGAEYDALPATQRAQIQETLEFLREVEGGFGGEIRSE